MSYRKIEVNGKVYEYSVGRTHTKIRGIGAYKNEEVGNMTYDLLYNYMTDEWEQSNPYLVSVTPKNIADFIKINYHKINTKRAR